MTFKPVSNKTNSSFEKLWVVIPAYNEESTVKQVIDGLIQSGFKNILVVNDGSKDCTLEKAKYSGVKVVTHEINRGNGAAIITGMQAALKLGAVWVVTCDADGQHLPEDVLKVAEALVTGEYKVVFGSRFQPGDSDKTPIRRRIYNILSNIITLTTTGISLRDSQSGLRGYSLEALEKMDLQAKHLEFPAEVILEVSKNKLSYCEVPIKTIYTEYSKSKGNSFMVGIKSFYAYIIGEIIK